MKENIPEFLYEMLINEYSEELANKIIQGYASKRPVTFRVNTIKTTKQHVIDVLKNAKIRFRDVLWYEDALVVEDKDEKAIRELDIYKNGEIYLQSLSSIIPPIVLDPKEGENILDMTAAPGGKTTEIATLSNNKAMITACEKNKIRAERLKYNLDKQGATRVSLMMKDARRLDNFFSFDKILIDAPCSGSGTIDSNRDDIEKHFTKELVSRSVKTQKELLRKGLKILKARRRTCIFYMFYIKRRK